MRRHEPQIEDFLPEPPHWRLDWAAIDSAFEWVRKLRGCTQDPVHHAEGDVWTHVGMVMAELVASAEWRAAPRGERLEAFAAALLHDVCKPETRREEDKGRITHRGHSKMGAKEARLILWRMGWEFAARERVCAIIVAHQIPFWLIERPDWEAKRILTETSLSVPNRLLALVAEADARGRICADRASLVDNVELFRVSARELGCFDAAFAFANDHTRFQYFRAPERRSPLAVLHDVTDPGFVVTVMSGLPGSGKSTWIAHATARGGDLEGQPVVSLDEMRAELDIDPAANQGKVRHAVKDRAKVLLRERRSFVWDATNVGRQMRSLAIPLFAEYGARVRIAYVEAKEEDMLARNRARGDAGRVPDAVMLRLMHKWEPPTLSECHELRLEVPKMSTDYVAAAIP